MNITKFEVGKSYCHKNVDDMGGEYYTVIKVLARTACTVKVEFHGEVRTYRILKGPSALNRAETIAPWGQYSMCEYIKADREYTVAA